MQLRKKKNKGLLLALSFFCISLSLGAQEEAFIPFYKQWKSHPQVKGLKLGVVGLEIASPFGGSPVGRFLLKKGKKARLLRFLDNDLVSTQELSQLQENMEDVGFELLFWSQKGKERTEVFSIQDEEQISHIYFSHQNEEELVLAVIKGKYAYDRLGKAIVKSMNWFQLL